MVYDKLLQSCRTQKGDDDLRKGGGNQYASIRIIKVASAVN